MTEFQCERRIAATRKDHLCCACGTAITSGSPAIYYAAKADGEMHTGHYHIECRIAEVAWNDERDTWGEDWDSLSAIREDEDSEDWLAWLAEHHPIAAERVGR